MINKEYHKNNLSISIGDIIEYNIIYVSIYFVI